MPSTPRERNKRLICLAAVVAGSAVLAAVFILHVGREMTDFGVCYQGGQRILQGETLYREADGHLQFKYSPASALFFSPLALLPFGAAKTVWYVLEFVFLAGILLLSFRMLPIAGKKAVPIVIWTFLIELKLLAREIELGQVNLLILFLLISMLFLLLDKRDYFAGSAWGISLFFKPYALVFLPYFIVKRKFRTLASGLTVVLIGLSIPALFFGFRGSLRVLGEWPASLSKSTTGLLAGFDNASLFGFLYKTFPALPEPAVNAVLAAVFVALAVAVLWMIRKGQEAAFPARPEVLEGVFLLILIPLFSPLGWNYNYLYSVPAVMLLIASWRRFSPSIRVILIVNFLAVSTSLIEVWGRALFHLYTHYALVALNFLVVLAVLIHLRARRIA